jgi:cytochrome c
MKFTHALTAAAAALFLISGAARAEVDEDAATALAKKEKCTKCHSADKKKDGPSYKETAEKYKGKADAVDKLYAHLTTGPMMKIDGKEEKHAVIKTKDDAAIKNLIGWILSR